MNENFNGLNEANSLNNNEMNNENNLEPTLNSVGNTETLNMENVSPVEFSAEPTNNTNVSSKSVSVSEMGVPEVISPMSLNENTSFDTNIGTETPMTNPEPATYNAVNNNVSDFQAGVNPINNEINSGIGNPENVYPTTPNVGTSAEYGNTSTINEPEKKKNNLTAIIIIILVLVLGAVGGFFAYKYIVMSNPVTIIEKSLTSLGKETENAIKEYNSEMNKMLNGKMQNELSLTLNEYSLDLLMKMDMKNKAIAAEVDVTADNEDFLNVEGIVNEEAVYFNLLENAKNNFVYYEDFSEAFEITDEIEEVDPVLAKFITYLGESVKENLTKDDFEKSKEEITYKGKQVNATKYALTFNANNINPILETYKNKLVNDDKLVSYIAELAKESGYDKSEIKEEIVTIIDDMKLSVANEDLEDVKLLIYVKGSELVKISLDDPIARIDLELSDGINILFTDRDDNKTILSLTYNKDKLYFDYDFSDTKIVADFANGKYKVDITSEEDFNVSLSGTYKIDDNNIELTFNTEIEGEKYSGKIISKETISDKIKINIPTNALDLDDESNQSTLMEELEKMPIYPYMEDYLTPDYGYDDDYYYDDDSYYDDEDYYDFDYDYDTNLDYDSEWEF